MIQLFNLYIGQANQSNIQDTEKQENEASKDEESEEEQIDPRQEFLTEDERKFDEKVVLNEGLKAVVEQMEQQQQEINDKKKEQAELG